MRNLVCVLFLLAALPAFSQLSFVSQPTLSKDGGGNWWLEFEVSQATDVAVSIVSRVDSSVVRSLAAGVLGANAPAPLTSNTFHQKLAWDHKDDYGRAVTLLDAQLAPRVRAGMTPRLANWVSGGPYNMAVSFNGIKAAEDGSIYVAAGNVPGVGGVYSEAVIPIRRYDVDGNYIQTVFPPAANKPLDSVAAYGVNSWSAGSWAPKTMIPNFGTMTKSLLVTSLVQMLPSGTPDELILVNGSSLQTIRSSGSAMPQDTPVTLNPSGSGYSYFGSIFFAASHNPRYLYLSGKFMAEYDMGTVVTVAHDTGFWADGQVFKVEKATGRVTPWLAISGFPTLRADRSADIGDGNFFSVFHGVDIDDSGHVFVCDRFHKQIRVYDTNAVLRDSVPIRWPDVVRINKRTGELYVATRTSTAVTLYKFSGWHGVTVPSYSVQLATSQYPNNNKPSIILSEKGGHTILTIGAPPSSYGTPMYLRIYTDDGTKFTFVKDLLKQVLQDTTLIDFNRIAVDRRNETVYIQDCWTSLFKIENWANPVVARCSTSSHSRLNADDMAIDPRRGFLYVRENIGTTLTRNPITRYTLDHLHTPAPFPNTGNNLLTPYVGSGDVQGHPTRGMDVSQVDGKVIISHMTKYGAGVPMVSLFSDTGSADTSMGDSLIHPMPARSGGVKFDLSNNFYVGTQTRNAQHTVPAGYETDLSYQNAIGAIVKYNAGTGRSAIGNVNAWTAPYDGLPLIKTTVNAARVYTAGYAPFGGAGNSWMINFCCCRSPRFDVDNYGRLFIPNAITKEVSVVDNNDNLIVKFGRYGNVDSWGGLPGPGTTVSTPDFPLAYPVSAAASDGYIYVGDMVNWRMMRVKMDYALDNMPGTAVEQSAGNPAIVRGLALSSSPNPFHPRVNISYAIPGNAKAVYRVYNAQGRLVFQKEISAGVNGSKGGIVWNGRDLSGTRVVSGFYLGKLQTSEGKTLSHKLLLLE